MTIGASGLGELKQEPVTFSKPVQFGFMHLAHRLEALLGRRVDLLAADGIKPNRRDSIHASLIQVAPSR
jgi:predicted nucleotidyltransferase